MGDVSAWPVDYEALKKGDKIHPETIERWSRLGRAERLYPIKVMELISIVQHEMRSRGTPVTCKADKGGVLVLTDADASIHNERRQQIGVAMILRRQRQLQEVDVTQLSDEEKANHERRVLHGSYYALAIVDAQRKIAALAYTRQTPDSRSLPSD